MKTVLVLLVLLVIVGLGYYRGWFNLSSRHDLSTPNATSSVDKDKVADQAQDLGRKVADKAQDLGQKAVDTVQDLGRKVEAKIEATTQKAQD